MNCLESQELLQRRLDGAPPTPDRALEQHLAVCTACRERHAAARRLLEALKAIPQPIPPADLPSRIVATALRDRQRRRVRLRRSLYITAALAAAIVLMLLAGYLNRPASAAKGDHAPVVRNTPLPDEGKKAPVLPAPAKKKDEALPSLAALSERLADKTLDQAKVLWTAANPIEGMPMGELPAVADLDPAAQPLRQAKQEVNEGLQAVGRSARRAFDYFSRELPMLELPQGQ
jgi:anti-sigma factor RsiW